MDDRRGHGQTGAGGKALVLGSDHSSFLSVIRSLGRRGIEVHIAWCPEDAPAARSRYVSRAHRLPHPADDRWAQALAELMRTESFDLVLPTNDPTLIPLQLARAELETAGRIYLLGDRAFEITFDKVKTRQLAVAHDVPVAPGRLVSSPEQIDAILATAAYPLVIKPQLSFNSDDLDQRNSVCRVDERSDAREAIEERLWLGHVLVEECIEGPGWGMEVLASDGEILLSQQHERLHEPQRSGGSSYRRTVPRHPAFLDAVTRLVSDLRYTGVAMFEFKGDPDGRWVLIEINGRFWGSLPLSLAAGIDFPYGLWQLLVDGRNQVSNQYRTDIYARNLKRDMKWAWVNRHVGSRDATPTAGSLSRLAREAGNLVRLREHTDQFTLDDPWPGLAEFGQLGRAARERLRSEVVGRAPLRQRRQRRARTAFRTAGTILFVCHGNICRSPFAAAATKLMLPPSVAVLSAGTGDVEARRPPSVARRVAREFGVDLDDHRSRRVTRELVERADAIYAFDEHHRHELVRRYPAARGKLFLIGALGSGPWTIGDPLNGSERVFRRAYADIKAALAQAARL